MMLVYRTFGTFAGVAATLPNGLYAMEKDLYSHLYTETLHENSIIVLSDPRSTADEALGRVFNALASAYEFKANQDEVTILFQGAGSRWPAELSNPGHPVHGLFVEVQDKVAGISAGCANVFGAASEAEARGFRLIRDSAVPGTDGLPSLRNLVEQGYSILTF